MGKERYTGRMGLQRLPLSDFYIFGSDDVLASFILCLRICIAYFEVLGRLKQLRFDRRQP